MVKNTSLVFKKVPEESPKMGEHLAYESQELDLDASLSEGSVLIKVFYTSLDPYMRGRMSNKKSYVPPFPVDQPMTSRSIGKVLKSSNADFKEGQLIAVMCNMSEYAVIPGEYLKQAQVLDNPHNINIAHYLGALGMPGLTAYSSLYEIGKPKKGETIFVSAASGAVGQLVVQLAKHEGLNVIGSVGDDKKVEFLQKELGIEKVFNYKKEATADALARLAPDGLDIFYDNVGGQTLDDALAVMNVFGRIVECGQISQYNLKAEDRYGLKNFMMVVGRQLTIRGFIVSSIGPKYHEEHQKNVGKWIADGSFKAMLDTKQGIEQSGEALLALFTGANFGKAVVQIAQE